MVWPELDFWPDLGSGWARVPSAPLSVPLELRCFARVMVEGVVTGTEHMTELFQAVGASARASGVFGDDGTIHASCLEFSAKESAAPASYRVEVEGDHVYVALVMADRWLSHSIEADLLNTGDKMEDLLDEELAELGVKHLGRDVSGLAVEHFRSEDKLFTFRSRLPGSVAQLSAGTVSGCLLAYEACFGNLGDMRAAGESD